MPFAHVRSQIGKGADQLLPVFFTEDELEKFGQELSDFRATLFKREFMPHAYYAGMVEMLLELGGATMVGVRSRQMGRVDCEITFTWN